MHWQVQRFTELNTMTLFQIFRLRVDVFVVEQKCYYPEIDDFDSHPETLHVFLERNGHIAAYLRLLSPSSQRDQYSAIGRVIVDEKYRGEKLGNNIMQKAISLSKQTWPNHPIKLSAQTHLQAFYRNHGFEVTSPSYLEDGIPHIDMILGQ